jgi:hypothetical protein
MAVLDVATVAAFAALHATERANRAVRAEIRLRVEFAEFGHPPPGPPLHGSSRQLIADL